MKAGTGRARQFYRIYISLLLLFFVIPAPPPDLAAQTAPLTSGRVLTVDEAVAIALQNQPSVAAQTAQVRVGESRIKQSQAAWYPQVSVAAGYYRISPVSSETNASTSQAGMPPGTSIPSGTSDRGDADYDQYSTSASVSQLLFDFGKTGTQVKIQELNTAASRFTLQNTKDEVTFAVKQAYYTLLGAQQNYEVAAEAVEMFRKHLDLARNFYRAGLKPRFDVTKAEVDLSNAELGLIRAENNVRVGRVNLNNAMGLSPADAPPYTLAADGLAVTPVAVQEAQILRDVYERRSDLQAVQRQKEAAGETVRLYRKGYFPVLSGVGSYTYVGTEFPLDAGWYAGANIVVPVFSGFMTKHQVAEARAAAEAAEATERDLKLTIALELEQAFLALREAVASHRKAELAVRQAKENQELAQERYRAGIGTAADVTDAVVAYAHARLMNNAALCDYQLALARIERAGGGVH